MTATFVASGVFSNVRPGRNPKYVLIEITEELLTPDGCGMDIDKVEIYAEATEEMRAKLHMLAMGDMVSMTGTCFQRDDVLVMVAQEIETLNCFLTCDFDSPIFEKEEAKLAGERKKITLFGEDLKV